MRVNGPNGGSINLSFRQKVVLLAVLLVAVIQVGTLIPVLSAVKRNVDSQADRSVRLAGLVFDEFIRSRTDQLTTTVDVLVADFGFRNAVASGDKPTLRTVLDNHAARAGTDTAVVFDLDGNALVSTGVVGGLRLSLATTQIINEPGHDEAIQSVTFIDDRPYQTVTVPVKAPVPIAWVMLGFPIDATLAADISSLTGLEASFVRFGVDRVETLASTLPMDRRGLAASNVHLGQATGGSIWGPDFITSLRPFLTDAENLYVTLQLPVLEATATYLDIRSSLLILTSFALLLAVGGAVWISRMVSRPVQDLAAAARRMKEGVYTQAIDASSNDEFGDLAAGFNAMQDAIAERERQIFHIAHHDSLSGLPTRDIIVGQLRDKFGTVDRLAVVNIVLNRFNAMASSLGHRTADQVIKLVAGQLRNRIDGEQLLGHLSQQEFVLVLPGYGEEEAQQYVMGIKDMLRAGIKANSANISLQATAGLSLYPDHSTDAAELLRCAAIARSEAGLQIESVLTYRAGQEHRALQLIRIVGDFPRAIKERELEVEFQPKIDCETLDVVGAEALVRWRHPELGLLAPDTFIEAIEQAGGIAHLTRWILRESIAQCAMWRAKGVRVSISVNISVDDLVDEYLPYFLMDITSRNGIRSSDVTLEVTESAIMHNVQKSLAVVSCMRELGFRVAIDDFGTGQASLEQLKRLPVDELKIDKTFVMNMDNRRDEAIVRTAIELAHQFGLSAVAEGVEEATTLERLRELGCEYAQGFHIARPLPPDEFLRFALARSRERGSDIVSLVRAGT